MERVTRHLYVADDWGVGELWLRGGRLLHHVLAGDDPSLTVIAAETRSGRAARLAAPAGARAPGREQARAHAPAQTPAQTPAHAPAPPGADTGAHPGAHTPKGAAGPPGVTVSQEVSRDRADFVPEDTAHAHDHADDHADDDERIAEALAQRFQAHLAGLRVGYDDVEVELDDVTPFERALAEALRGVAWGEVVTYGELAALAGSPRAARAAGSFCARGGLSLVLPYHRVIAASGIGGYGPDGVPTKRRLLALEGVRL